SATAFGTSFRSTSDGTSDRYAGPPNDDAQPATNDNSRMCQMRTTCRYISSASMPEVAIWMYCEVSSVRLRSLRSATTPATSENRGMGSCCGNGPSTRKTARRDSDAIETMSQFCATICIHVPILDVHAPTH